jgi:hypothetical protein
MDLHASRRYGGMGTPEGISYQEIVARAHARGRQLYPVQVDAIRVLDREYLMVAAERVQASTSSSAGALHG